LKATGMVKGIDHCIEKEQGLVFREKMNLYWNQ